MPPSCGERKPPPPVKPQHPNSLLNVLAGPHTTPESNASGLRVVGTLQEAGGPSLPALSGSTPLTAAIPTTSGCCTSYFSTTSKTTVMTSASTGTLTHSPEREITWLHWCANVAWHGGPSADSLTPNPQDIRLLGQTKYGIYDQVDAVDPALLHRYYGAGRSDPDVWDGGNEVGVVSNADGQAQRDIAEIIADSQARNIQHDAAEVAETSLPFENRNDHYAFSLALSASLNDSESYPAGFNLQEEYETSESYRTGRSTKPLEIPLPYDVWFPRVVVWCKALNLLKRLPLSKAMSV